MLSYILLFGGCMKYTILIAVFLSNLVFAEDFFEDEFEIMSNISTGRDVLASKSASIVSVLDQSYFKQHGFNYVKEAIGSVNGIYLAENTLAQSHSYVCRGNTSKYNSEVLFMINDTPIKSLLHGNVLSGTWVNMSLKYIDKIEVIRGSGSAVYGADAFSCVINLYTKKEDDVVAMLVGTNETYQLYYANSFEKGNLSGSLGILYEESDGFNAKADRDAQTSFDDIMGTNASLAPNKGSFQYESLDIFTNIDYKNLNIYLLKQQRSNIGGGFGLNQSIDHDGEYSSNRNLIQVEYADNFIDTIETTIKLSQFDYAEESETPAKLNPSGTVICASPDPSSCVMYTDGIIGEPEIYEKHQSISLNNFYYELTDHILRFGIGYNFNSIYKSKDTNNFIDTDGNGFGDNLNTFDDTEFIFAPEKNRHNTFAFIQDEWDFSSDIVLTLGGRLDSYNDFGNTFNPRVSLVWNTNESITNKFIYGKAFRAPTIAELYAKNNPVALGNPDLEPETIDSFEYAIIFNNHDDLNILSNIYYYKVSDDIRFVTDDNITKANNVGSVEGYGLEFESHYIFAKNMKLSSQYAYQYTYDLESKKSITNYPSHMANISLHGNFGKSLSSNLDLVYVGKKTYTNVVGVNKDNATVNDSTTMNIVFNYNIHDTDISLIVNNVFDVRTKNSYISNNPAFSDLVFPVGERAIYLQTSFEL
jgi:iron complex outermembrane receptor protein